MKEPVISSWDDVDFSHNQRTPATHNITLGLNGKWVELDLNDLHHKEVTDVVMEYMKVGTPTGVQGPRPRVQKGTHKDRRGEAFYAGMRAYGEAHGMPAPRQNAAGGHYKYKYSARLRREYEAYLAEQQATTD